MPLGWYLHGQWRRFMGSNYIEAMCDQFIKEDREWKNFAYELPTVTKRVICVHYNLILMSSVPVF